MKISINVEIMLCKETINNDYNGPVAEYNFLVPGTTVRKLYEEWFAGDDYKDFENFLDTYNPEYEGSMIYQYCKIKGEILYEDWNPVDWDMSDLEDQMAGREFSDNIIKK